MLLRRRTALSTTTAAVVAAAAILCATGPAQAAADPTDCTSLDGTAPEPNLDGGEEPDFAVGVPTATVDGLRAGAVDLRLRWQGTSKRIGADSFTGVPAAAGDLFGAALTTLDQPSGEHNDICQNLVVGAPGSDNGRGAVIVAQGGLDGPVAEGARRLVGRTAGEAFGAALASNRGSTQLFVGAPNRTVAGRAGAGAVDHYVVPNDGSPAQYVGEITENSPGVPGVAEVGDHFGSVLALRGPTLAVGVPAEAAGSRAGAGDVVVMQLDSGGAVSVAALLQQGYAGSPGVAEAGDHFGAALAWTHSGTLVVGGPGEAVGRTAGTGIVYSYLGLTVSRPTVAVKVVVQDTPGIPGIDEAGDRFGATLATVNWCPGEAVAVGSPGEDVGSAQDAGQVTVVQTARPGTSRCERAFYQGSGGGLGGAAESGDQVGASLENLESWASQGGGVDRSQLLVGIPGEGVGSAAHAGGITVISTSGATWPAASSYGDTEGRIAGERYGEVLLGSRMGSQAIGSP